jgi:hypothetical protein
VVDLLDKNQYDGMLNSIDVFENTINENDNKNNANNSMPYL